MSTFEKLIIPFIVDTITPGDLTKASGFIDSYTSDPDNPTGDCEYFLVYDDSVRNEYSQQRALRLEACKNLKRTYVKTVNKKPYFVYSFWVPYPINKFYNGTVALSPHQKEKLLRFWGYANDVVERAISSKFIIADTKHDMPLHECFTDLNGIEIQKEEMVSDETVPSFYFYIILRLLVIGFLCY